MFLLHFLQPAPNTSQQLQQAHTHIHLKNIVLSLSLSATASHTQQITIKQVFIIVYMWLNTELLIGKISLKILAFN